MTIEQARAELVTVMEQFFAYVEKAMDQGVSFDLAVMTTCREHPDLIDRENQLRDYMKCLGQAEQSISARDLLAWSQRQTKGAISCAAAGSADLKYCIVLAADVGAGRKRMPIAMLGVRYKGSQKIEITRPMLAEVVENFRKRDSGEVPIDYDHGIEMAAGDGRPVPAAGWIKALDNGPDSAGILWGDVEWTPQAASMIASKQYKYISPVLDPSVHDNRTGKPQGWTLTSAALTNTPVLQGMPALVLSAAGWAEEKRRDVNDDWESLQAEVCRRVKQRMADDSQLKYDAGLRAVLLDDRDLARRYQAAKNGWLGDPGAGYRSIQLSEVDREIDPLVREKIAASEGRMDYGAAWKAVLTERRDLMRRRRAAMK